GRPGVVGGDGQGQAVADAGTRGQGGRRGAGQDVGRDGAVGLALGAGRAGRDRVLDDDAGGHRRGTVVGDGDRVRRARPGGDAGDAVGLGDAEVGALVD